MPQSHHTPSSLTALAARLGGDCYAGGRRALLPAPGHSPQDRSVSLALVDGRVLVHTFGAAGWREVLADLRDQGWIDAENRLLDPGGGVATLAPQAPDLTRRERKAAARRLWDQATPVAPGTPAAAYAAARGVDLALDTEHALRFHAGAPLSTYRDRGPHCPALLAGVRDADGALTAVEITYLDGRGRRSTLARPARKVVGVLPAGSAVRLAPVGSSLLVAEGVFTTLSAMARFKLRGWALLSTSNLRRWTSPAGVARVLIAADRGQDGERSAGLLRATLQARGVAAEVALPPPHFGDWNDLDQEEVRRKGG